MNKRLKSSKKSCLISRILLMSVLVTFVLGQKIDQEQPDCDLKLLHSYRLKGLRRPSSYTMHICPHVRTKCCTLTDELSIYQLWKGYASYNTKKFYTLVSHSWFRLVDYHEQMMKLDRNDITVHYMSWRWVPYIHRMCDHRFIESKFSKSNTAPMSTEVSIGNELPGQGRVRPHKYAYKPDYLDVITKKAHMKKVIEIYKAAINKIFVDFTRLRQHELKAMMKAKMDLYVDEQKMFKNNLVLAYEKRKKKKNRLHIFHPKDTLAIIKAKVSKVTVEPLVKAKGAVTKKILKAYKKANKFLFSIIKMLKYESVLSSMYNVSRLVDYEKLKKYIYHFVLRFRYWHKPKKKIKWNRFRPHFYNVNMMLLPKCSRRVIRWHENRMREENHRRFVMIMNKKNRKREQIIRRRKHLLNAWKNKHMKRLDRRKKILSKQMSRKKKKYDKQKEHLTKEKKRKEKIEEMKIKKPNVVASPWGRRLRKNKRSRKGKRSKRKGPKERRLEQADNKRTTKRKKKQNKGRKLRRRGRRRRHGRHGRRGHRRKPNHRVPFQHARKPWLEENHKRFSTKGIINHGKKEEYNFKVAHMHNLEKQYIIRKRRGCNYKCRLNKLPRNIDFNNMCILPKKLILKKRMEFYGKFRKNGKGDWVPVNRANRGYRRQMRRHSRRRGYFSKRRRRKLKQKKAKKKKAKKGSYKVLKNASPPERHLSLVSSVESVVKPLSQKAMKFISGFYKKPVAKKKGLGEEYISSQVKKEERSLTDEQKLEDKRVKLASTPVVEQKSVDNGVVDGRLSQLASADQVSLKTGVDMGSPQTGLDPASLDGTTTDGLENDPNRELFFKMPKFKNPFAGIKAPKFGNPFKGIKGPKFKNPFAKKKKPPKPKAGNLYLNPRDSFYVKPPKMGKGYDPSIDPTRAKKMIPLLLKEKMELTSVPKGFFYRKLKYPLPMIGSFIPRDEMVTCRTFKRHLWKSFINVNREKIRYCYRIYDSLESFDIARFRKGMLIMRLKLADLLNMKRGFYCAICDYDRQAMFDHKNKLILYRTDFCINFLHEYKELINFHNVIMVEYMDQMLQLIECYRGHGRFFDFPYRTFLEMHKRRIYFIQRCFAHRIQSKDPQEEDKFLKNCMFICNQFNYISYSRFIDGDLRTLNIVLMRIFQYLREMRFSPYIKLPPYQFLIPYEYPAVKGSKLESSRGYQNDLNDYIRQQLKIGKKTHISKKAMSKNNEEETLRQRVNRLQYDIFYKKKKHYDLSIDYIPFNKNLRKRLKMLKMMSLKPPNYIPNKIKMAEKERTERAYQKRLRNKLMGIRGKRKNSTRGVIRQENKIIRGVNHAFDKAAREHVRHKKKLKRLSKKKDEMEKRLSRELKFSDQIDDKLASVKSVEDASILDTFKQLQNDQNYYGVDAQAQAQTPVADVDKATVDQKLIPERRLAKKKGKKGRKGRKKKKRRKKKVVILTTKVKNRKTGEYRTERVPHRVTSWKKYRHKLLKKKKKKFDRFKELTRRQSGDFAYYPPDSEHIMHGIYQEKKLFYDLKRYRPMYLVHMTGLDPLVDHLHMDLDIDPKTIIRREYNIRNPEAFDRNVILQYFGIPNKTISDFNYDITQTHYTDLVRLKEMAENPKPVNKRAKMHKKRDPNKPWKEARQNTEMMKRHHVYPKKHKNPEHHELGIHEYDPATSADMDSQFMFYMFDHRSKYPIFRHN